MAWHLGLHFICGAATIMSLLGGGEAAAANPGGYLFATFKNGNTASSEQLYFGVSKDGRNWTALNQGEPVLISTIGANGIRDPFLIRSRDGKKYYLIATNLSMHLIKDWSVAKANGGRSIIISESSDLVHWSLPRLAEVAPEGAGCAWAPEAIYDEQQKNFLVFWASTSKKDGFSKFSIWAARTKDFRNFGEPFVYIEKQTSIIDTTIVHDGPKYYRFTKDEKFKAITMESSQSLTGEWRDVPGFSLSTLVGHEGPEAYLSAPSDPKRPPVWTLILDQYSTGEGYRPFVAEDISTGKFEPAAGFSFPFKFRHGSVLSLSRQEFNRLQNSAGARTAKLRGHKRRLGFTR